MEGIFGCVAEFVGQNGPPARPVRASLMGQNGAPPRWLRGMMSFSLWTVDCRGIRESGTEWSPHVGVHFQAVLSRKQGVSRALEPAFTHRFCYGDGILSL